MRTKKKKDDRKNVGLNPQLHTKLWNISENTGISMTKLIDMAVDRLVCDPPVIVSESEVK